MGVITARTAGFCWGVRRAVDMVLAHLRKGDSPFGIYGELVHNPQVQKALEERGVCICRDPEEMTGGTLFLRTHGTTLKRRRELNRLPVKIRDLTCPRVGRALALARKKSREGYDVIILGDPGHQEVKCIKSYGGEKARVIEGIGDLDSLSGIERPFLLSQTTQNTEIFQGVRREMKKRWPELEYSCTICDSTGQRQEELRRLCSRVDCVVVVGGRNSANTARLAKIAEEQGLPAYHIETHEELDDDTMGRYEDVLLTAGASTPSWSIRKVRERLLEIQGRGLRTGGFRRAFQNMIFGNFHVLPVTFSLGAAAACAMGNRPWLLPVLVSSLFLFAAHCLTSVLESGYSKPSGLRRQEFLRSHRVLLTAASITAFALSLGLSMRLEIIWPLALGLMLAAYLLYSLPLIRRVYPFSGLRSIPGSRDVIFAGAWSFLLAFLPGYAFQGHAVSAGTVLWAGMLFFLFLSRCLLADLVDLQGDALMGMDTIPIHAGKGRSIFLFWLCFTMSLVLLVLGVVLRLLPGLALAFAPGILFLAAGYAFLLRMPFPSELAKRSLADGSLFLAGVLPFIICLSKGTLF